MASPALLAAAMTADPGLLVLGESVGRLGGLLGMTEGLLARFGEDRVRDLPIPERGAIGLATGLALGGRRVVVEVADSGRLLGAIEALAEAGAMAAAGESLPLVVTLPWGGEAGARLDRPVLAVLADLPGVSVLCPHDAASAERVWREALASDHPCVVLQPRALVGDRGARTTEQPGAHLLFVAFGPGVEAAEAARDALSAEGVQAGVIAVERLAPLDLPALSAAARATGRVVVAASGEPAYAQALLQGLTREAFDYLESPPVVAASAPEALAAAARASLAY